MHAIIAYFISLLAAWTSPPIDAAPSFTTMTPSPSPIVQTVLVASNSAVKVPLQRTWSNVAYATKSKAEKLDIYLPPQGNGPFPLIAFIHGGGFVEGDKTTETDNFSAMLMHGYAVISINYRLANEAVFPAQIQDIKAAIRFIRAHADTYNLNSNQVAAWGGSAGGTLAALAGTTGNISNFDDPSLGNIASSSAVQAVVDWFGPINFLTIDEQFKNSRINPLFWYNADDSPEAQVIGKPIQQAPQLVERMNPETYISSDVPPFFIEHGTQDHLVPFEQSVEFAARLLNMVGSDKVHFELISGADHADPLFSTPENLEKVFQFLNTALHI